MTLRKTLTLLALASVVLSALSGAAVAQTADDPTSDESVADDEADLAGDVVVTDDPNRQIKNIGVGECMMADGLYEFATTAGWAYPVHSGCELTSEFSPENVWEFHDVGGRGGVYQIRHPMDSPDSCLSSVNNEGGDTVAGDDVRLEPCEGELPGYGSPGELETPVTRRDDLWYFQGDHIRNYTKHFEHLCLQNDTSDNTGERSVQLWACYAPDGEVDWSW